MQILNPKLILKRMDNGDINIIVDYDARFSAAERDLTVIVQLNFLERIFVIGVDPSGSTTGAVLDVFPLAVIEGITPAGTTPDDQSQTLHRHREKQAPRAKLDEDSNPIVPPDIIEDEIRCKIQIDPIGVPRRVEAFTNQFTLGLSTLPALEEI
jgi:hypothetical protein